MNEQHRIISNMTPQEKLKIAMDLYRSARQLKKAWLKNLHPDWSNKQIEKAVREIFLHARS